MSGKVGEAIEHFKVALHIKPNLAEVHDNWGAVLVRQGQLIETIRRPSPGPASEAKARQGRRGPRSPGPVD